MFDTKLYKPKSIFLADDDSDDCMLFEEALNEVCQNSQLTTANDGQELMEILGKTISQQPDVIFLDLNMPRKNGFECLDEIKHTEQLKGIPIIVLSTSSNKSTINRVYDQGADYYICKPSSFPLLKDAIKKIMSINWKESLVRPTRENFFLSFQ